MKITEKLLAGILVLSIVLKLFSIPGNSILLVLSSSVLMMLYFYVGFAIFNDISFKGIFKKKSYNGISALRIVGAIFSGIGLSIVLAGILFRLQHWPGGNFQLLTGIVFSAIILIILIVKYIKGKELFYKRLLTRFVFVGVFGLFLFLTTDYSIDKIKMRNYPEYVKAIKELEKDPENETLRQKVEDEYNKAIFTEEELKYMKYQEDLNK